MCHAIHIKDPACNIILCYFVLLFFDNSYYLIAAIVVAAFGFVIILCLHVCESASHDLVGPTIRAEYPNRNSTLVDQN